MYADQHLHTSFSGDSETPPEEQAEKAIALGMERICFTDHHDHDVVSDIRGNPFAIVIKVIDRLVDQPRRRFGYFPGNNLRI